VNDYFPLQIGAQYSYEFNQDDNYWDYSEITDYRYSGYIFYTVIDSVSAGDTVYWSVRQRDSLLYTFTGGGKPQWLTGSTTNQLKQSTLGNQTLQASMICWNFNHDLPRYAASSDDSLSYYLSARPYPGTATLHKDIGLTHYESYRFISGMHSGESHGQSFTLVTKTVVTSITHSRNIREDFTLYQNYPNPANPATTIQYRIPKANNVLLELFDLRGKKLRVLVDAHQSSGTHAVEFPGDAFPSGVYFYRLTVNRSSQARKFLIIK